jgi:hypothetical protein
LPIATALIFAACADIPDEPAGPDIDAIARISGNRISGNRISGNRIGVNRLSTNRLTGRWLTSQRMRVNISSANTLLASEGGRDLFSVIVSCALPEDVTLVATVDGDELEFTGELNLAPQWLLLPLDPIGQGWVSACTFAKVNNNDVALPISMRGPHPSLDVGGDERDTFLVEEGAFFGTMFGPLDKPIQWFACRGEGQAAGELGGLIDRDCTEPDPAHPGLTKCGFMFAGDCGEFATKPVCESFSERGTFYRQCHTAPIQRFPRLGDRAFSEVVTSFVTP